MKRFLVTVIVTCLAFQSHAEKWVNVGAAVSQEFGQADIYADADSAVRTGELASIKTKSLVDQTIDEVNFDCKKNLLFTKFGDQFSTDKEIVGKGGTVKWPVALLKNLQSTACKRSYEFWK